MMNVNFQDISLLLHEINIISILVRVILAMVLGGLIGMERGIKNMPAGFRTYILVCLGATIVMLTNQYIYQTYPGTDPSRLGAQVVSGIGFLGAGTIIVTKRDQVKGLTTAAGLWAVACVGIAIGIGFYSGAIVAAVAIYVVNTVLLRLDRKIKKQSLVLDIYIEFNNISYISSFLNFLQSNNFPISDLRLNKGQIPGEDHVAVIVSLKNPTKMSHSKIIEILSKTEGIEYIEEL